MYQEMNLRKSDLFTFSYLWILHAKRVFVVCINLNKDCFCCKISKRYRIQYAYRFDHVWSCISRWLAVYHHFDFYQDVFELQCTTCTTVCSVCETWEIISLLQFVKFVWKFEKFVRKFVWNRYVTLNRWGLPSKWRQWYWKRICSGIQSNKLLTKF